jgi:hypothetical protein
MKSRLYDIWAVSRQTMRLAIFTITCELKHGIEAWLGSLLYMSKVVAVQGVQLEGYI